MLQILVDADACPVKEEAVRVAERHRIMAHIVSNGGIRPSRSPFVQTVIVPEKPDAADDWIAEHADASAVVVTADIPLASRCLKKGALVLGPDGRRFTEESIGLAMGMRDLNRHLREVSGRPTYNPSFSKADRSRFLAALEEAVQSAARRAPPDAR